MKAQANLFLFMVLILLAWPAAGSLAQEQPDLLFEKALFLEESAGDLSGAIAIYDKIVRDYGEELATAAKAQFHIGLCFEKLGRSEAVRAYDLVVQKYSSQMEQVAAARSRVAELRTESANGFSTVKLTGFDKPGTVISPYDISSDGKFMIGMEYFKGQNIVVCNFKTQEVKYITDDSWSLESVTWSFHPLLSPDGLEIVYHRSRESGQGPAEHNLMIAALAGKSRTLLSGNSDWYIPNAWLPDGTAVLVVKGSNGDEAHQLGLISRSDGVFYKLTTLKGKNQFLGKSYPISSISPDGRYIVVVDNEPGEKSDIYIIKSSGGVCRPFIFHPAADSYPRWSPDGRHVVFYSLRHGSMALWGVAVDGDKVIGEPFLIRDGMKDTFLMNWTAHGLAGWSWVRINDIFLMELDPSADAPDGKPCQLQYTPTGNNRSAVWAPDSRSFAFLRRNMHSPGACVVVVGDSIREFPVPDQYEGYDRLRWSPDGREIGMLAGNAERSCCLVCVDQATGTWKTVALSMDKWSEWDWCKTGTNLLLIKNGFIGQGAGIFELNLDSGIRRTIYCPQQGAQAVYYKGSKCSRDYSRLAVVENDTSLLVVNMQTGACHRAASHVDYPSWSGARIMAVRLTKPDKPSPVLAIFPADGGPIKEIDLGKSLAQKSEIREIDWSPDGKKVVFTVRADLMEIALFRNIIPDKR